MAFARLTSASVDDSIPGLDIQFLACIGLVGWLVGRSVGRSVGSVQPVQS